MEHFGYSNTTVAEGNLQLTDVLVNIAVYPEQIVLLKEHFRMNQTLVRMRDGASSE